MENSYEVLPEPEFVPPPPAQNPTLAPPKSSGTAIKKLPVHELAESAPRRLTRDRDPRDFE
ncbi:MAG: hypothetical protein SGJ20_18230 [Planctomycetota bacterium]|nr:hypothetical protein [Planctomycetota bacterium]